MKFPMILSFLFLFTTFCCVNTNANEGCPPKTFNVGDRVSLSKSFAVGSVLEIISNLKIKVIWDHAKDGDGTVEDVSKLSKATRCFQDVCVDNRVMGSASSLFVGIVREVFEDGSATVQWQSASKNEDLVKEDVQKLARSVACYRELSQTSVFDKSLCVGDRIRRLKSPDYKLGSIVEIFEHKKAKVLYDDFASNGPVTEEFENIMKLAGCNDQSNL